MSLLFCMIAVIIGVLGYFNEYKRDGEAPIWLSVIVLAVFDVILLTC